MLVYFVVDQLPRLFRSMGHDEGTGQTRTRSHLHTFLCPKYADANTRRLTLLVLSLLEDKSHVEPRSDDIGTLIVQLIQVSISQVALRPIYC